MRRVLGVTCLLAIGVVLGCGGGDDDDGSSAAGSGGAAGDDGSHTNAGSGGHVGAGSGGKNGGGGTSGGNGGIGGVGGSGAGGTGSGGSGAGGSGSGGAGVDLTGPTAKTAACIEYIRGFCASLYVCSNSLDDTQMIAQCVWNNAAKCPDVLFAEGSTRTVEGSYECAQKWREVSCADRETGTAPACATSGMLPGGAQCISGFQCAARQCGSNADICSTCRTLAAAGETCDDGQHVCDNGYKCISGVCTVPPPPVNQDAGTPPSMTAEIGDACSTATAIQCATKYDCKADPNSTTGEGHCVPYPRLGEDCSDPLTCEAGDSYCDISKVCLVLPTEGQPCGRDGFTGQAGWCAVDHSCDTTVDPPVCHKLPAAGAACAGACGPGLTCMPTASGDPMMLTCAHQRMPGESCADPADRCLPGATRCEGGVCVLVESQGLVEKLCPP